jgi:hypothetical protein
MDARLRRSQKASGRSGPGAPIRKVRVSREDRWIYFSLAVTEADVWLMNMER